MVNIMQTELYDYGKTIRDMNYQELTTEEKTIQKQTILQIIKQYPEGITDKELEQQTGLPINIITARRNDLMHYDKNVIPLTHATIPLNPKTIYRTMWGYNEHQ